MSVIENLLRLQESDLRIRGMERELADIPARKTLEQDRLAKHKKELEERSLALKTHLADLKMLEAEVQARHEKIRKFRQQQMELKTNKEFRAVEIEVAAVEKDISGFEDKELALMDQVESVRADVKIKEKALAEEDAAVKRDMTVWDQRAGEMNAKVQAERVVRAGLAQSVDPAWLSSYDRIFLRKDRALVPVEDGVCGGCHMQLPPFVAHEARKKLNIVTCGFCGRMLYCV